ncbi:MAG: ATP-binding protein, partial [Ilumatobacteraceae bacterium]
LSVATVTAWVPADGSLLVRLVRNLVDNALRHARRAVRVVVTCEGAEALVRVWNDGPPIPDDDLERIFQPFTRLDEARASDDGGAGLGLSIARQVAEVHGGSLVAEPCTDGASFVARLPLA